MKIVYMGTPDFAVAPLAALAENGYEVEAVITQPDKPKGRGKTMMPTPVKEEALKHGIPVLQPVKVRDPEFVEELKILHRTSSLLQHSGRSFQRASWICRDSDVSISMRLCFLNIVELHQSSRR